MAQLRFIRTLLAAVALAAPFVLATIVGTALVTPLATASAALLLRVTAPLATPLPPPAPPAPIIEAPREPSFEVATKPPRRGQKAPVKPKASALFVSQATVLKLAQSAARPRGVFVKETEQRPAGLLLSGVTALGIGLQDGDVLIEALGVTPRAPEQVVGAIIEARAKQARFLSGTVWRAGQTFRITVEQPYLPLPA